MILYLLIILFTLISFFLLYTLSRNDFILLRKNIILAQVFNYSFIILFFSYFFGRLFYVANSQNFLLLNPLAFMHFVKYPGFSVAGAFFGGIIILSLLVKDKKALPRLFDIVYLSFFPFFALSLLFISFNFLLIQIISFILSFFILFILLKFHRDYTLRDGSIFLIIIMMVFLTSFIGDLFVKQTNVLYIFSFLQIIDIIGFVFAIVFIIKNEFFTSKKS